MGSITASSTVLITGAGSGIGRELVPFFAGTGHNLVLAGCDTPVLEGIAAAARHVFRVNASVIACDLAAPDAASKLFAELAERNIEVDILVNHAGAGLEADLSATQLKTEQRMIQTNIAALTAVTNLLLPGMIARGKGKILNVASAEPCTPLALRSVSEATKAYVLSYSEALSEELRGTGVTVTALCPTPADVEAGPDAQFDGAAMTQTPASPVRTSARVGFHAVMLGKRVANLTRGDLAKRLLPRLIAAMVAKQTRMQSLELQANPNGKSA